MKTHFVDAVIADAIPRHSDRAADRFSADLKFVVSTAVRQDTNVQIVHCYKTRKMRVKRQTSDFTVLILFRAVAIAAPIAALFVADFAVLAEVRSTSVTNAT